METRPVIFLDGTSLAYRAFYALPRLATSQGRPTGATLGFLNMLLRLLDTYHPLAVIAAFDHPEKTFRHAMYREYKAQRKPMPDEMKPQLEDIKELLSLIGFRVVERAGLEGDDLIGSGVTRLKGRYSLIIVTSDLDLLQVLDEGVVLLQPIKGIAQLKKIDQNTLLEEWGIRPSQVVDVLALAGDPSDNIPGVPGVGEKTAVKLVREFGSWEGIRTQVESLPFHLARSLREYQKRIEENRELLRVKTDILMVEEVVEAWDWHQVRWENLFQKLESLELRKLSERLRKKIEKHDGRGNSRKQKGTPSEQELFPEFHHQQGEPRLEDEEGEGETSYPSLFLFLAYPFFELDSFNLQEAQGGRVTLSSILQESRNWVQNEPGLWSRYWNVERELWALGQGKTYRMEGYVPHISGTPPGTSYEDLPLFARDYDFVLCFDHPELSRVLEEIFAQPGIRSAENSLLFRTLYGWRFLAFQPVAEAELCLRFKSVCLDELFRLSVFVLGKEMAMDVVPEHGRIKGKVNKRDVVAGLKEFASRLTSLLPPGWEVILQHQKNTIHVAVLLSRKGGHREIGNHSRFF